MDTNRHHSHRADIARPRRSGARRAGVLAFAVLAALAIWGATHIGARPATTPADAQGSATPVAEQSDVAPAHAQDEALPVGIDSFCGADALRMITAQQTLPADQAVALDDVLRKLVTMPEDSLSALMPNPPSAGAGILVDTPHGRYLRTVGVADVHTCAPLQPHMPLAIGSNTKMMTVAIIYQLQEEGLLSTEDQVSVYLPEEIARFPRSVGASIAQVLSMTAGLPDYFSSSTPNGLGTLEAEPESPFLGRAVTPQELIAWAARIQDDPDVPQFAPGEPGQWRYSNTGYIMLGLIIEKVTGQSYSDALTTRIFEPLGLSHTVLVTDVAPAGLELPSSYQASPFIYDTSGWNYSQGWAAGAVVSTAEDLATFVKALYSGRLFQSPMTLNQMQERAAPGYEIETDHYYYAHGSRNKHGFWGHGGQTLGFVSDPGYDPETDTTIVVWQNVAVGHGSFGVFHAGHALGLTPSWDDVLQEVLDGLERDER
jgi:D-alanyl-D-alanine carboxypeptidase